MIENVRAAWQHWLGYGTLFMALQLTIIATGVRLNYGRNATTEGR